MRYNCLGHIVCFFQVKVTSFIPLFLSLLFQAKRMYLMRTPRTMITFKPGEIRFTYRVGGILIQNEHVLCQAASSENFFFLTGGRAELGETASATLQREMQEELGLLMKIERLLY